LRAREAGLSFVYLGYWVDGAARMQYKTRYRPLEKLSPDGWVPFGDIDQGELLG
jgi:arginine-tRNA-protein transferase